MEFAMEDRAEPFNWWGWHWQPPQPLSVMQLIEAGSLDTDLLALLWAMLARRASLIVAAEPPLAGKTTTLTALLDLTPPDTERIYLRGHYETFDFTEDPEVVPQNTYVLANEMSDHLVVYLWGSRVYRTFELIEKGFAIGSTMHAETVEDVIAILDSHPLDVPARWIGKLGLVINLYVNGTYGTSQRRFNTVHMLGYTGEGEGKGGPEDVEAWLLSSWDKKTDTFQHRFHELESVARLAVWAGCAPEEWEADVARRREHLDKMRADGVRGIAATRSALAKLSTA
jgi:hypothetical protein